MTAYQSKYKIIILSLLLLCITWGNIQDITAQQYAIKANALSWISLTPQIEGEIKLSEKMTANINLMYRPWHILKDNKKVTGIAIQPEVRYWFCQTFYKHFLGLHFNYADYNSGLKKYRYQGYLLGAGISYGYQMILSKKWNLEFNIGAGYASMNHDKFQRIKCGSFISPEHKNYFGITKAGISLIYFINGK